MIGIDRTARLGKVQGSGMEVMAPELQQHKLVAGPHRRQTGRERLAQKTARQRRALERQPGHPLRTNPKENSVLK
jgi:hypothetical protein